jgi:hypothetical protein
MVRSVLVNKKKFQSLTMDEGEKNKFRKWQEKLITAKSKFVDKSKRQHFGTRRKLLTAPLTTKHWHLIWNLQSNSSFLLLFTAISASLFQTVFLEKRTKFS